MINLPSKRVIWLVIVLVVIAISILWFAGRQERQNNESKKQAYIDEILKKEAILEELSQKELTQNNANIAVDELAGKPIIATSTTSTSSQQALRKYGLDLATALKPLSQKRESEAKAVLSAIDNKDATLLKPVTSSRITHEQVASNLKKVIVPKEIASGHFKIASQVNLLVSRLKNMEQALTQPTAALEASQTFNTDYLAFIKSIEVLNQFFALNKVQFSDQEKMQIFVSN